MTIVLVYHENITGSGPKCLSRSEIIIGVYSNGINFNQLVYREIQRIPD